jgi:hypothetical protein
MKAALEPAGRTGEDNLGHSGFLGKLAGAPSTTRAAVKCKEIPLLGRRCGNSPLRPKDFAAPAVNSLNGLN